MKGLTTLVLLSSVGLLCSSAPALEPVTCSHESRNASAKLAVDQINKHHHHGYKYRLHDIQSHEVEQVDSGCNIVLNLDLLETECHVLNPKHYEDCSIRDVTDHQVKANCFVNVTVEDGNPEVTSYICDTQKATTEEMSLCQGCPVLIPLRNKTGFHLAQEAVKKFNENSSNLNKFLVRGLGRLKVGYIPSPTEGMTYFADVVLVESNCSQSSSAIPVACRPLCPDRARHAVCTIHSTKEGTSNPECEVYPALNDTALNPEEEEPYCPHLFPGPPPCPRGPGSNDTSPKSGGGPKPPHHPHHKLPPHHPHHPPPPHHPHHKLPPHHPHHPPPPHHPHHKLPPHHPHHPPPPHHPHHKLPPHHPHHCHPRPHPHHPRHHPHPPHHPPPPHRYCHGNPYKEFHPICPWP